MSHPSRHPSPPARSADALFAGRLQIRSAREGTSHVVAVSGELDLATADTLSDAIDVVLATDAREVTLDLTGVTFVALRGLRVVTAAQARCATEDERLNLRPLPQPVQRILMMTAALEQSSSVA